MFWILIYSLHICESNSNKQPKNTKIMDYKAHTFASIGNGKLHPSRTSCGRHLQRNSKGTHVVRGKHFLELLKEDEKLVCEKCLAKLKNQ